MLVNDRMRDCGTILPAFLQKPIGGHLSVLASLVASAQVDHADMPIGLCLFGAAGSILPSGHMRCKPLLAAACLSLSLRLPSVLPVQVELMDPDKMAAREKKFGKALTAGAASGAAGRPACKAPELCWGAMHCACSACMLHMAEVHCNPRHACLEDCTAELLGAQGTQGVVFLGAVEAETPASLDAQPTAAVGLTCTSTPVAVQLTACILSSTMLVESGRLGLHHGSMGKVFLLLRSLVRHPRKGCCAKDCSSKQPFPAAVL